MEGSEFRHTKHQSQVPLCCCSASNCTRRTPRACPRSRSSDASKALDTRSARTSVALECASADSSGLRSEGALSNGRKRPTCPLVVCFQAQCKEFPSLRKRNALLPVWRYSPDNRNLLKIWPAVCVCDQRPRQSSGRHFGMPRGLHLGSGRRQL